MLLTKNDKERTIEQNLIGGLERVRFLVSQFNALHSLYYNNYSLMIQDPFQFPMYHPQIHLAKTRRRRQRCPRDDLAGSPLKPLASRPKIHYSNERKKYPEIRAQQVTAPSDLTCRICWVSFKTRTHWLLHIKYFHYPPSFKCSHCPKAYKYKIELNNHILLKHNHNNPNLTNENSSLKYSCPDCKKPFQYHTQLNTHILRKHSTDAYVCQFCGK